MLIVGVCFLDNPYGHVWLFQIRSYMGLMAVIKVVNSDLHYCYKYDIMNCNAIDLLMVLEARLLMY